MKRRRLKSWVVTSLFILLIAGLVGLTIGVSRSIIKSMNVDNNSYVLRDIANYYLPVNSEIENIIKRPFSDESVKIHINFYDANSDEETKSKSLIKYERTYLPNTGVLYGSEQSFDVLAVFEGEVIKVDEDEMFGKTVEIKHKNNLTSKYSSLSSVNVNVGDTVQVGEVIGKSGNNKIVSVSQNMLLCELIYNGEYVNPEKYFNTKIEEMN